MAFNSFVRRASSSILPLSVRSSFGVVSSFRSVEKHSDQILSVSRFSTNIVGNLFRLIDSDVSNWKPASLHTKANNIKIPDGFPFEIEDIGKTTFTLRRMYEHERIRIHVDTCIFSTPTELSCDAYISRGTQDLKFEMKIKPDRISILNMSASCLRGGHFDGFEEYLKIRGFEPNMLNFWFNCFRKTIPNVSRMLQSDCSPQQSSHVQDGFPFKMEENIENGKHVLRLERQFQDELIKALVYYPYDQTVPHLGLFVEIYKEGCNYLSLEVDARFDQMAVSEIDLSGNLKAFTEFWETRGLKPSTTNFLFDYIRSRET